MLSVSRGTANESNNPPLEVPLFVHGQRWPELPHLPKADQLSRPPQYIADLLVNLYFDQLHYTLPVLHKPHFLARYKCLNSSKSPEHLDKRFLSVFFAVCACAASLLPSDGKSARFPGLDYYEKSLLLHYASHGEASLEGVQCLALLAMCSAGWNTLTQSWNYAGRAVRAAQDLGIHLSSLVGSASRCQANNMLFAELNTDVGPRRGPRPGGYGQAANIKTNMVERLYAGSVSIGDSLSNRTL